MNEVTVVRFDFHVRVTVPIVSKTTITYTTQNVKHSGDALSEQRVWHMKFIADRMLGRLTKLLRIYGFDTLYSNRIQFKEVLRFGREEGRIVLTRNTQIKRMEGKYRYLFIKDNDPKVQLDEVITGLNLKILLESAFTRCLMCNCELEKIERTYIEGRVPDYIFETHRDFSFCAICKRIFWKGTHHEKMLALLQGRGLP